MAEQQTVAAGDIIEYIREDAGGSIVWKVGEGSFGWLLTPGEQIVVGRDIPVDLCNRLVETKRCAPVPIADAPPPTTSGTPVKPTAIQTPIAAAGPVQAPNAAPSPDAKTTDPLALAGPSGNKTDPAS